MKIIIERFKNITKIEIPITPLTLLIGGNNSGKSSILQAIQFAVSAAQTTGTQNAFWKNNRLATSVSPSDLIYSPLRDVYALSPNSRLRENEAEAISIAIQSDEMECIIKVRKGRNKNIQIELVGESIGKELQSIENPYSIIVPGLAGIPSAEEYETPLVVRKAAARGDSNSVFRNILLLLKKDKIRWSEFRERLNDIFPSLSIEISFDPDSNEHIECHAISNDNKLPIDSCGTGVLQAIQILSYASLYHPKLLILDEPDSHLHPDNQRKLSKIIHTLSRTGLKIIISTHSLHLVDALLDSATTHWIRNGQIVGEANDYELKALIDIGALNEGDELRNARIVVLAEDEKKGLIENLFAASGFNLDECEIWSYNGCSNIQTARTLISYIKKHNPDCVIIIHRDRDCMTDDDVNEYKNSFTGDNVYVFIPELCDLESLFCTSAHIASVFPEITNENADQLFYKIFKNSRDQLLKKYINSRIDFLKKNGIQIDAGKIAVECGKNMDQEPRKFTNGKIIISGMNEVLNQQLNRRVNLKVQSTSLRSDSLLEIKKHLTKCG